MFIAYERLREETSGVCNCTRTEESLPEIVEAFLSQFYNATLAMITLCAQLQISLAQRREGGFCEGSGFLARNF